VDSLGYATATAEQQDGEVGPRGWLALATGLNLAFAVCSLTSKAPSPHVLSWASRLGSSLVDLVVACLFGAFGTWLVLPSNSRRHLRSLVLCGARGWVFLPAIALLLQQESLLAPLLTIVAAALMANSLSSLLLPDRAAEIARSQRTAEDLFRVEIALAPASWGVPLGLSCCLYGALLAALADWTLLETALLSVGTLLFVLRLDVRREEAQRNWVQQRRHLGVVTVVAFCCIVLVLSASSQTSYLSLLRWRRASLGPRLVQQTSASEHASGGFHTIVLWPMQKKERSIIAPPLQRGGASPGITKRWSIPFDGPYWYFKFSGESPGPNTRTTHGDPLKVNVRSTDEMPLLMEAHQQLSKPLDLTCCREMQIVIRNDLSLGAFAVGLLLTDSHAKGTRSQSLGVKAVNPSAAAQLGPSNSSPVEQVLTFPFPKHGVIKSFDAITVSLLPDARHRTAGRRVAVERFILIPN
jgi:hypothetical protein